MHFSDLGLIEPLLRSLQTEGYTTPTEIQRQSIPLILEGRDLIGSAQTGTGKTAAFALPILQRLHTIERDAHGKARPNRRAPRALILTPTRELAAQVAESFKTYGRHMGLRLAVIFGGVGQGAQCRALRAGVDILVATPGRLKDLHNQGEVNLSRIEVFTLDEADRMLDMGFLPDIKRISALLPDRRQTILFSATMPPPIRALTRSLLHDPATVTIEAESAAADTVEQHVCHVPQAQKMALLCHLLADPQLGKALIFTRTKHGADRVAKQLNHYNFAADAIHGNKNQNARIRALAAFASGRVPILVASDVASRGIDVDDISHVFNFDMPNDAETYVHRIGRTGRGGAAGIAVTFATGEDKGVLRDIQRMLGRSLPVMEHTFEPLTPPADKADRPPRVNHPLAAERSGGRGRKFGGGGAGGGGRNRQSGGGGGKWRGRKSRWFASPAR